jgi:hypothetical protein
MRRRDAHTRFEESPDTFHCAFEFGGLVEEIVDMAVQRVFVLFARAGALLWVGLIYRLRRGQCNDRFAGIPSRGTANSW